MQNSKNKEIVRLYTEEGLSQTDIAAQVGLGHAQVQRILQKAGAEKNLSAGLKRTVAELKNELKDSEDRANRLAKQAKIGEALASHQMNPPTWSSSKHVSTAKDNAIVTAFLSDLHLDEVVDPRQVNGVNAYNRKIALKRLKKFFDSTLQLTFDHMKGIQMQGLVMPMGGDMFSGNIHEELKETNEATIIESVLYWSEQLTAGVELMAKEFKKVHIPCVVGNHGRMTRKPTAKNRAQDNYDWLLYHMIARQLKQHKNVTFDISESADTMFHIYGVDFQLTHGDQFKGGGGIAGLLSPLMLGAHRKLRRQVAVGQPFHYMVFGHWHQYMTAKNLIGNGSLKGYDEYAFQGNFDFEPPQQAYWLTQPRHGITISGPVHVEDPYAKYL
jgi:hypothetical protein